MMKRVSKSTAGGPHLPLQPSSTTSVVLLATALLLGWAGSVFPSAGAAAAAAAAAGGIPAPSSGVRYRSPYHDDEQRQPLLPPLGILASPGSRSGRSSRPSWFAARNTRGGGLFRRRRGGGGGGDGEPEKREGEEEHGQGGKTEKTAGFAVAAGTIGGSGGGGGSGEEQEGAAKEGGGGEGTESQEEAAATLGELTNDEDGGAPEENASDAVSEVGEEGEEDDEGSVDGMGGEEEVAAVEGSKDEDGAGGATAEAASAPGEERRKPVAPLFSFPPGPRARRTEAEESLQEVLPMQQRLVKYLTEDRVFGAQILCSIYFFVSAASYSSYRGNYQAALAVLTLKQWGTVLGRVRRVLVPHLLYEPQRYVKYRARVSALALDPAVQGILYCAIFMLMPLGHALIPLLLKESVYLLWVIKEVLQIAAPGTVEKLTSLSEPLMSIFMTAGDGDKWRDTPAGEKRLLLGRRLAQVCFKLEMAMPFSVLLHVLPGALQATLGAGGGAAVGNSRQGGGKGATALASGGGGGGGIGNQFVRALPLLKVGMLMMVYVKLLTVKNAQLEDDVRILKGLKIRGYNCEWIEQAVDSVVFGKMVGCPWWVGLLASGLALLPNHEVTKTVMASEDKLKTLGMTLLNLAIGRTPGASDDDDEEDDKEVEKNTKADDAGSEDGGEASPPRSRMAKLAKVAAVATGVSDF